MALKVDGIAALSLVGSTPFARLEGPGGSEVWLKLEGNNPGGVGQGPGRLGHAEERGTAGSAQ